MEHSALTMLAVVLVALAGSLQPAIVVASMSLTDRAGRRLGVLASAAIAVGAALLLFGVGAAVGLLLPLSRVGAVLLLLGLACAAVIGCVLLARRLRSGTSGRVLATIAAVLVAAGQVLQSGPALFGLSSSPVVVLLGLVVGAVALIAVAVALAAAARRWTSVALALLVATLAAVVTGVITIVLSLLHILVPHMPTVSLAVSLGVTVLAGLVALVVGAAVKWRVSTGA